MNILSALHDAVFQEEKQELIVAPKNVIRATPVRFSEGLKIEHSDNISCDTDGMASVKETIRLKVHPKSGPLVEFFATLQSLSAYIVDESARYHATQDALKARGISISDVLANLETSSGLIDAESRAFSVVRDQKTTEEVTKREAQIAAYAAEINKHQDAISDITSKRDNLAIDLVKAKTDISSRTELFSGGAESLKREYAEQANKIKLYLIGGESK